MTRAKGPTYEVSFRRRREGKTRFDKRLAYIKSGLPRMVVRKSNRYVRVQFIEFFPEGDRCIITVDGARLKKVLGWDAKRNVWSAYLAGMLAGKEAAKKGVKKFVLDIGMHTPSNGAVVFAALKGAVDSGLETNFDPEKIPEKKLSNPPEKIKALFEDARNKIAQIR
ncbi:MAG: 50S ribosomal protein L18 [Candidatus Bilamarchaeaceae archaeon]